MFWRQVELYSYVVWLLGQRQLLLSLLGMSLILICSRFWRRQSSASVLAAWLFFLSWLVWAPLVFTPERLQDFQSPLRHYWTMVAPADVFTLCSQSILHRLRTPPLAAIPQLNWNLLIISGWGLLAAWRAGRLWQKRRYYTRIVASAPVLDDTVSRSLVDRWRHAFSLKRPVELRSSEQCHQAFTIGLFRPVIFLPQLFLQQLDPDELDAVVGHEMAHVKRCDDVVIRLQRWLKAVFFFNPVLPVANRKVAELREQCCDRLAMEYGKLSASRYGKSLLRALALNRDRALIQDDVAGLGATPLRRRIESLLSDPRRFSWTPLVATALCLSSLSLLFGHTGSDPINARASAQLLEQLGAVAPIPGTAMTSKAFTWPTECAFGLTHSGIYHPGVDFAAPAGRTTSVRSIAAGRVTHVSHLPRLSPTSGATPKQIHISHQSGLVSSYLYVDNTTVKVGDRIAVGDVIAHVHNTGTHHGHVHVEVHQRGRLLDPSYLLTAR